MSSLLTFEHGNVLLDGNLLPGLFRSLKVHGAARFDEAEPDELSGTVKAPLGWEDAGITIELDLLTGPNLHDDSKITCYDKLQKLNAVFKDVSEDKAPKIYSIVSPHVSARGIEQVVFAGLDSTETDEDDVIEASLNFIEHNPPVTTVEKQSVASNAENAPAATTKEPEADTEIVKDPGPFAAGFSQGAGG